MLQLLRLIVLLWLLCSALTHCVQVNRLVLVLVVQKEITFRGVGVSDRLGWSLDFLHGDYLHFHGGDLPRPYLLGVVATTDRGSILERAQILGLFEGVFCGVFVEDLRARVEVLCLVLGAQSPCIQGHLLHVLLVYLAIPEALEVPNLSVFTTLSSSGLLIISLHFDLIRVEPAMVHVSVLAAVRATELRWLTRLRRFSRAVLSGGPMLLLLSSRSC